MNCTSRLSVTKHDPDKNKPAVMRGRQTSKKETHPLFRKYTDIQHQKRYGDKAFEEGSMVILTEKIHGTNFRAGWVPNIPPDKIAEKRMSWWDEDADYKVYRNPIKWLKQKLSLPKYTFVWGSHNVQLKPRDTQVHDSCKTERVNVYEQCVMANKLWSVIPYGQIWYGEIYGPSIQKGYGYGLKDGECDVRFFDVRMAATGEYLDFDHAIRIVQRAGAKMVPYWTAVYDTKHIDYVLNHKNGGMVSAIDPNTDIEGLVIRSPEEEKFLGSRRCILKWIGDAYLLKKGMTEYK